jgi:tetratricopeptide (TPR) repeat protein
MDVNAEKVLEPAEVELTRNLIRALCHAWSEVAQGEPVRKTFRGRLEGIAQGINPDDLPRLLGAVQRAGNQIEVIKAEIKRLQDSLRSAIENRGWEALYTEPWWDKRKARLREMFLQDRQRGMAAWCDLIARAIADWEIEWCERITQESFPFPPGTEGARQLVAEGVQALREIATMMLKPAAERQLGEDQLNRASRLLQAMTGKLPISDQLRVTDLTICAGLLILLGRLRMVAAPSATGPTPVDTHAARHDGTPLQESVSSIAPNEAQECFTQASLLLPDDARAEAVLGDLAIAEKNLEKAAQHYQRAIQLSPVQEDGYLGMAVWSEANKLWDEAGDWYRKAIAVLHERPDVKDLAKALDRPLAPASGNAFYELARFFKGQNHGEEALSAIETALKRGIRHKGLYPERLGLRLKGDILEVMEPPETKKKEAALAHHQAAEMFLQRNDVAVAIELLTHAADLDPDDATILWDLSNVYRVASYRPNYPFVDRELNDKSIGAWQKGMRRRSPNPDENWVYLVRALCAENVSRYPGEDEWERQGETIVFLERAVLLGEDNPYVWGTLIRFHRRLKNLATALQISERALKWHSNQPAVLMEWIGVLAELRRFEEADEQIKRLEDGTQDPVATSWLLSVRAYLMRIRGEYEPALQVLDQILKIQFDIWYVFDRVMVLLGLGRRAEAEKDMARVWELHDNLDYRQNSEYRVTLAWTGILLGHLTEADELLAGILGHPVHEGIANIALGFCRLRNGRFDEARAAFERGLARTVVRRELDETAVELLPELERQIAAATDSRKGLDVLNEYKTQLEIRRDELPRDIPAEEELKRMIARCHVDGWAWLGLTASLARLAADAGQASNAHALYDALTAEARRRTAPDGLSPFPEAEAQRGREASVLVHSREPRTGFLLP